jgi:hypothetical protein
MDRAGGVIDPFDALLTLEQGRRSGVGSWSRVMVFGPCSERRTALLEDR